MSAYIGIFILSVLPAGVSSLIHFLLVRKKGQNFSTVKTLFFYVTVFYSIISLVKMVFDGGRMTMVESFLDICAETYIHYMVPLLTISVAIPFLLFRYTNFNKFIYLFDSFIFSFVAMALVVLNGISHSFYVSAMFVSMLATFAGIYWYKGEISYCSEKDLRRRVRYAVPIVIFNVLTVILFLPGSLFLNNRSEIPISSLSFMMALLIGSGVCFCFLLGGIFLLTCRQFALFYTAIFALTLSGYIQNLLLNGHMMSMDGGMQSWSKPQAGFNILIWSGLVLGIFFLKLYVHKDMEKLYRILSIYLSLVQSVSFMYLVVMAKEGEDSTKYEGQYMLSTESSLALHPENNVIVFVLDWYDEQILEHILLEEPEFLHPLSGFTYYSNATSLYAFTGWSVPYLLTGIEWRDGMGEEQYREYAFDNSDLVDDIVEAGYDVGIYTDLEYVGESILSKLCNYVVCEQYCNIWETVGQMAKCSKYQMAPICLKNQYWYTTDEIVALAKSDEYNAWITYDDLPFWTSLKVNRLDTKQHTRSKGSYRFYHMYGAHNPYHMSEDCVWVNKDGDMMSQSKGSMKIVFEYVEQLKSLGGDMYENATIIITADHGQNYTYDSNRAGILPYIGFDYTSSPILLVKNAGETWEGIKYSNAPVTHTEMIASMINAVNSKVLGKYGRTLEEVGEDEERERIFIYMREDVPYFKNAINGDARNWANWSVIEQRPGIK